MDKKKSIRIRFHGHAALWAMCLAGILLLDRCAGVKPKSTESLFKYQYKDETYQIRSVFSGDNGDSYNELWGDRLVAIDLNQDGVIDNVLFGEAPLSVVQDIYAFGIQKVGQNNKLKTRLSSNDHFRFERFGFTYEISSYRPVSSKPFNEFKVIDTRLASPKIMAILLDRGADGTLDEIIKGDVPFGQGQARYTEAIEKGLKSNALVKIDGTVQVQ
jgi:hypothetical protein